ncbi:hypothetical protein PMAC_001952 [Pneumocystis sp. 'macacae']|nr:hypothetical protein PMAC_001952 [Pneumocystis sp. 'macacae']
MLFFRVILCSITFMIASGTIINHTNSLCTATNPKTNQYVDLRGLQRTDKDGYNWLVKDERNNRSYCINICAPLISNTAEIHGINHENVSAIYTDKNETFSIGSTPSNVHFQGEKLVLQYENGSLCPGNTTFRKTYLLSLSIAFIVYCIGGCIYRSIIMYARGWKRVPHYGIFFFLKDILTAFFTTLCSKIPGLGFLKQNYNYIRHIDEENRLIDDILVDD